MEDTFIFFSYYSGCNNAIYSQEERNIICLECKSDYVLYRSKICHDYNNGYEDLVY